MNKFINVGAYYHNDTYGNIRTICKAEDVDSGNIMVAYVNIDKCGNASDVYLMREEKFKEIFIK